MAGLVESFSVTATKNSARSSGKPSPFMYSGTTLTPLSGRIVGAHQKIDRLARKSLQALLKKPQLFPGIKAILHFEGLGGPDAIKRKSPAVDEPWHFFNPFDEADQKLTDLIVSHYKKLVKALKDQDDVRAAFEAAWMAHAVVDGLTPAHHYPYEEKLIELRGGEGLQNPSTITEKFLMPGNTPRERMNKNWQMWGAKGLFSTHFLFEWGVATVLVPLTLKNFKIDEDDIADMLALDMQTWYTQKARQVAGMGMYDAYYRHGWTISLARQVRNQLAPLLVQTVSLAWYRAALEAGIVEAN